MPAPVLLTDQQVQDYPTHGYLVRRCGHPAAVHRRILPPPPSSRADDPADPARATILRRLHSRGGCERVAK